MSFLEWLKKIFVGMTTGTWDKPSPADILKHDAVSITDSKVIVDFSMTNIPFTAKVPVYYLPVANTKSMDGIMDYGNCIFYLRPYDKENHQIMVDWIADQWEKSGGFQTCDCAYRIPPDFSQPAQTYNLHRLKKVEHDDMGRYFIFRGVNNSVDDPYLVRDENIIMLATGVIY